MARFTVTNYDASGAEERQTTVDVPPAASCAALRSAVAAVLGLRGAFTLSTAAVADVTSDEQAAALRSGEVLHVFPPGVQARLAELCLFAPHPNVMLDSGDYVEKSGKAPVAFALSDLVDNALAATLHNAAAGRPRNITVAFVRGRSAAESLLSVNDNGCAMTCEELKQWAVMSLTLADRARLSGRPSSGEGGEMQSSRYLNSGLSWYGVGSKQAAFFLGSHVKVVTHAPGEAYVHELCIESKALTERWEANRNTAYEDVVRHRPLRCPSTLLPHELRHPQPMQRWVEEEGGGDGAAGEEAEAAESFTRLTIGDLNPAVFAALSYPGGVELLCRELAHVFHYYVHGEGGNRDPGAPALVPDTGPAPRGAGGRGSEGASPSAAAPHVSVEEWWGGECRLRRPLAQVEDCQETLLLRAARAEFHFRVAVPPHALEAAGRSGAPPDAPAVVFGTLSYYPRLGDLETLPQDRAQRRRARAAARREAAAACGGEEEEEEAEGDGEEDEEEEGGMFETFWQGRLIPETSAPALPFIAAAFSRTRSAADKDALPDCCRRRLRGQLFFSAAFKPTRNKLSFATNLPAALAQAEPVQERALERRFKEWLLRCHASLDRGTEFAKLAPSSMQAKARLALDNDQITVYETATGVLRTDPAAKLSKGDLLQLRDRSLITAKVVGFLAPLAMDLKAAAAAGPYKCSGGEVLFVQQPAAMHGDFLRSLSLRRVEKRLDAAAAAAAEAEELKKAPAEVVVTEPLAWACGLEGMAAFAAGQASLPEMKVLVRSGGGKALKSVTLRGETRPVVVTQRLLYRGTKERPLEEVVSCTANSTPLAGACFIFRELSVLPSPSGQQQPAMARAGSYELRFSAQPALGDAAATLTHSVHFEVQPGCACELSSLVEPFGGEGGSQIAGRQPVRLGATAPRVSVRYADAFGNPSTGRLARGYPKPVLRCSGGVTASCKASRDAAEPGTVHLTQLRFSGSGHGGMAAFLGAASATAAVLGSVTASATGGARSHSWAQPLLPGLPASLELLECGQGGFSSDASGQPRVPRATGGALAPPLRVRCLDAWGNPTAPLAAQRPGWHLLAAGEALHGGGPVMLRFDEQGIADGARASHPLRVVAAGAPGAAPVHLPLTLTVVWEDGGLDGQPPQPNASVTAAADVDEEAEGALVAPTPPSALPTPPSLALTLAVTVTRAPARFTLQLGGRDVCAVDCRGSGGAVRSVLQLEGDDVVAGTQLSELSVALVDASGAPCAAVTGTMRVSWAPRPAGDARSRRGAGAAAAAAAAAVAAADREFTFTETAACQLPPLTVPCDAGVAHAGHYLRFTPDDPDTPPVEADVVLLPGPGEPCAWHLAALPLPGHPSSSASASGLIDLQSVACDAPFLLAVDAWDEHGNRCPAAQLGLPPPRLRACDGEGGELLLLGGEGEEAEEEEDAQQPAAWGPEDLFTRRVRLRGPAGDITLFASDAAGLLKEESMTLELAPGPAVRLAFAGRVAEAARAGPGGAFPCAARSLLPGLQVQLVDAHGNAAAAGSAGEPGVEVALSATAAALDAGAVGDAGEVAPGQRPSASVQPVVGRALQRRCDDAGLACFGDVKVSAPGAGRYLLRAGLSQRAKGGAGGATLELAAATLVLSVQPLNRVHALSLTLPDGGDALRAGEHLRCRVALETEDGCPLPREALDGLSVWALPPARATGAAAQPPAGKLELARVDDVGRGADEEPDEGGEDGGALSVAFCSPEPLLAAGDYSLHAEYRETRAQLAALLRGEERRCSCSMDGALSVAPGPAATLSLVTLGEGARLSAVCGGAGGERLLLERAAVEVRDAHGNAVAGNPPGAAVRASLAWAQGRAPAPPAQLPQLEAKGELLCGFEGAAHRATFKGLCLAPQTGCVPPGADSMAIHLLFEMQPPGGGVAPLRVPVDVTDKAAKLAGIRDRAQAQQQEQQARHQAKAARATSDKAARDAKRALAAFRQRAVKCGAELATAPPDAPLPQRRQLERLLAEAQEGARSAQQASAAAVPRAARWGSTRGSTPTVPRSLLHVFNKQSPAVLGCAASLGYVQHEALCRMLSWHLGNRMATCVVNDTAAMLSLRADLRAGAWAQSAICPFVSLAAVTASPAGALSLPDACARYAVPGEPGEHVTRRVAWLRDACAGSDEALGLSLPHVEGVRQRSSGAAAAGRGGAGSAPLPRGLVAHAVNLVRPARPGLRRTVWFALLGDTLVFDTLQNMMRYRDACKTAQLRCQTMLSLDCERVQSSGITEGSKPPPARLADMDVCFGTAPAAARAAAAADEDGEEEADSEDVADLRALLEDWDKASETAQAAQAAQAQLTRVQAGEAGSPAAGRTRPRPDEDEEDEPPVRRAKTDGGSADGKRALRTRGAAEEEPVALKKSRKTS